MVYEDFTTFTEVDVGADRIQKTANHIDHRAERDETTYLYKDYGAACFDDFEHKIKLKMVSGDTTGQSAGWMLANDLGNYKALSDGSKTFIYLRLQHNAADDQVSLIETHGGSSYKDHNIDGFGLGDGIYAKIVKSGTSLTAYLYSDSGYSTLVDTLSLTLHADHSFRYLYGCNTYNDASNIHIITDADNFDISETITKESSIGLDISSPYEDFTAFTEVDVGADRIQKTVDHIDHLTYRNEVTYLYKDYGAAHFDNFTHKIKVRVVSTSEAWSGGHTWLLANDVAGAYWMEGNNKTYLSIFLISNGSNDPRILLREMYNGTYYDDEYICSLNTWYYVKIVKLGTSINAYVYSDSDYSNLVDTLTLTLHANHTLRYLYGCNSDNDGSGKYGTLDIENFNLEEIITKESSIGLSIKDYGAIGAVLTYEVSGPVYNEHTIQANNATINDVQPMFDTPGDILYYGDIATYSGVKIKYSTNGVIGSAVIVLEYSKGSGVWGTLSHTDESNKFTEDPGTYLLWFTPPGDWATDTVDGKTHYWIRYRIASSYYTINPKLDQLWVFQTQTKESSASLTVKATYTKESSTSLTVKATYTKESSIGISVKDTFTKASSLGLSIPEEKTKSSSICLTVAERKTKQSSVGLSVIDTQTKASSLGLRIVGQPTKLSSAGVRIVEHKTKPSSVSLTVFDSRTKASSVGLSVHVSSENVSTLGITVVNRITKESSVGVAITGTNTKASSLGLNIMATNTKASSVGISIVDTGTKTSTAGIRIVDRPIKESSVSLTVKATYTKESSVGLTVLQSYTKESSAGMYISGSNTKTSYIGLTVNERVLKKGLFYGKLGDIVFEGVKPENFRITKEMNQIPTFEIEIANTAGNRAAIAAGIDSTFKIYWLHYLDNRHIFTGIINADGIEYISLDSIMITGFASYVKLAWPFHKHLSSEDAESVYNVLNYHSTYTDYTAEANNDTVNDVVLDLSAINDGLYIGENNPFWGAQIKYSTKGVCPEGCELIIEYSKGGGIWETLNVLDESYGFTEDPGTYDLIISHPPSDWNRNTVNNKNRYWIRFRIDSGAYSIAPKLDRIYIVNVDIYRTYYFDMSAREILETVLADTEYSMDSIDQCPTDEISIIADYESPLRIVAAIANALTWTAGNGDKKAYQWWIDDSKKVHMKTQRGNTYDDDITGDMTIFNNHEDYFHLSNRLIGFGPRDGLSQIRAIVQDRASISEHGLREIAVPKEQVGKYLMLRNALKKDIAISKSPMKRIKGSVTTEFWGLRGYDIGDTITLHQTAWNVDETAMQIVKAEITPLRTTLNLGISQEHLNGLKDNMQRQLNLNNVQMHGSTTIFNAGPETSNYERKANGDVYSAKLKLDMPSDVKKTHKMLLSWTIGPYRASVNEATGEVPGHDHDGFAGAGGAQAGGNVGAGGSFIPDIELDGGFIPAMLSEAHVHDLSDTLVINFVQHYYQFPHLSSYGRADVEGLNHRHSGGGTGYPSGTAFAATTPVWGCWVEECGEWAITDFDYDYFALDTHYHQNSDTGYTDPSAYVSIYEDQVVTDIYPYVLQVESDEESPAHLHDGIYEDDHTHDGVYEPPHSDHAIPAEPAHSDHIIITEPGTTIDIDYGIHEEAAGTTLELLVDGEKVGEYTGNQTEIRIDGYISKGASSTIEIQPVSAETSKKGGATIWASGILFIEPKKF